MVKFIERTVEEPWAYQYRKGFSGDSPGLYFRYFAKREDAEKSRERWAAKGKFCGRVEHRPDESRQVGGFAL